MKGFGESFRDYLEKFEHYYRGGQSDHPHEPPAYEMKELVVLPVIIFKFLFLDLSNLTKHPFLRYSSYTKKHHEGQKIPQTADEYLFERKLMMDDVGPSVVFFVLSKN